MRPGSSQSLSRIQASAVITPFIWRGGCADTNIVFSFRTHGHEKSDEFEMEKLVFLFFKNVKMNFKLHNNNNQRPCEVW